ncbi:MAG: hypothetical protein JO051_13665 [Acidobacteriaceae bacterium]|nr:hypothetical protein [Acidobacteriaceae bacterium]
MKIRVVARIFLGAAIACSLQAHVGSPDVYLEGKAGPYQLFVTIRPPQVIPGVAELEIRSETPGVRELRAVPVPITGPGAKFAPVPDKLSQSKQDAQFFTGSLWMMAPGSWQVRLTATGDQGEGVLSVPVPSAAVRTKKMQLSIGAMLSLLGLFLVAGVVAIVGASVREAKLEPGAAPTPIAQKKSRIAMSISFVILIVVVWGGNEWWRSEADSYRQSVYRPVQMNASLDRRGLLTLQLADSGWLAPPRGSPNRLGISSRAHSIDDLIPDHSHLMHLYAMRAPGLDAVYHLHPDQVAPGVFHLQLPAMPPGKYHLYADIVHEDGFPETPIADVIVPAGLPGRPLAGDDSSVTAPDWMDAATNRNLFTLPDGYRMEWLRDNTPLQARRGTLFRFRVLDQQGRAPSDMALYMGMLGHAAFIKTDGTVFAHIHPMGTPSMAAFTLAQDQNGASKQSSMDEMPGMKMPGMDMSGPRTTRPNEVSFPYGFPAPGRYRIVVQMKRGRTIESGVFDANVQ